MRLYPALVLALLAAAPALAAPPGGPPSPEQEAKREKQMERLETIRIARLTEELNLDPAAAARFFPAEQPFATRRRELGTQRWKANQALKAQLDSGSPDPRAVGDLLDQVAEVDRQHAENQQAEYQTLKKVLDPISLARYYKFQQEFQKNVQQIVQAMRKGGGLGQGPGGNRPGWRRLENGQNEQGPGPADGTPPGQ